MRNILILFVLSLSAMLSSCADHASAPSLLVQADSAYMRGDYQRADSLLDAYDIATIESKSVHYYFNLLSLCRKFVRSRISLDDLQVADSVLQFFQSKNSERNLAKAYLFVGNAYHAAYDYPIAMKCYLQADELAKHIGDPLLQSWAVKQIGNTYFDQRLLKECIPYYKQNYDIAAKIKDTLRLSLASYKMASVSTIMNNADSAIFYYRQTIEFAKNTSLAHQIIPVAQMKLCDIYIQTEKYDEAAKLMPHDDLNAVNWAYWHYGQHHLDSAVFFFRQAFPYETLRGRTEILLRLGTIEQERGNLLKSLDYLNRHIVSADSLRQQTQAMESQRVKAQFDYNKIRNERDKISQENHLLQVMTLSAGILILLIGFIFLSIIIAIQHKRKEEKEHAKLLRIEEKRRYLQSVQKIEENKQHIAILENQLQEARKRNDIKEAQRLRADAEYLQSENQAITEKRKYQAQLLSQLKESELYKKIMRHMKDPNFHLTVEEWHQLGLLIDKTYDGFSYRLSLFGGLSELELRVCFLVKLGVPPSDMANILFKSVAAISMLRKRMYQKITKKKGASSQFDDFIRDF